METVITVELTIKHVTDDEFQEICSQIDDLVKKTGIKAEWSLGITSEDSDGKEKE